MSSVYGVIFWSCPPEMFVYMPTNELLREESERALRDHGDSIYKGKTLEDVMEESRWGATQYMVSDYIDWDEYEEHIGELDDYAMAKLGNSGTREWEKFIQVLCRVGLRVQASGAFRQLNRTKDFRMICIDSSADYERCDRRLKRVRKAENQKKLERRNAKRKR